MTTVQLQTIQWSTLPEIDEVAPLDDKDAEVLSELREVLIRHGKTERFGVCLLHKHFDLRDDEVLMETTDERTRVSTLSVEPRGARTTPAIETMWRFSSRPDIVAGQKCLQQCDYAGGHKRVHRKVAT